MIYKITFEPNYTNASKLGLELDPDNEPLKFFFSGIKAENYPILIRRVSDLIGYGNEITWAKFHHELDWEDIENFGEVLNDELIIYHIEFGFTKISCKLFLNILYDYGSKLLWVHKSEKNFNSEWFDDLQNSLTQLKKRISNL